MAPSSTAAKSHTWERDEQAEHERLDRASVAGTTTGSTPQESDERLTDGGDDGRPMTDQPTAAKGATYPPESFLEEQRRALEEARRAHGPWHRKVAEILTALALFCQHVTHDFEAALRYHHQALAVLESQGGEQSCLVEVAVTLTDIGNVCQSMDDMPGALAAYRKALALFDSVAGAVSKNHPSILAASRGIAMLERKGCSA